MSGAERARRFRERLKAVRARSVNDADSANTSISAADHGATSTAAVLVPVDMMSEDINHTSVESGTACLVNNTDSESTAAANIPIPMNVTNESTTYTSIESITELRHMNSSRSDAMQNHWRSADERFKMIFEANPFGVSCNVCDRLWFERDLKKVKARNISFLETTILLTS